MADDQQKDTTDVKLRERFSSLPLVVQKAITSANVEKRLRDLANTHNLHLDQWQSLENEVMLALLGFQPVDRLEENIHAQVKVDLATAMALAADVSRVVFEPIRQELERELEHPEAKEKEVSGVDAARAQILGGAQVPSITAPPSTPPITPSVPVPPAPVTSLVAPATPPPPPPTEKAIRMPASGAYVPGETSVARKDIHDDPYREPPA